MSVPFASLLMITLPWTQPAPSPQPWDVHGPLCVSADGHYLQHADGTPFVWVGDTAWVLHQNLSREDVRLYLNDARDKGFTLIQLMTVNGWALKEQRNYFGETPYLDDAPWRLNPAYWDHLAWVIDRAARRGLYVLLVYGSPGRKDERVPFVRSPQEAYEYGNALGSYLRGKRNLIWCSGIDVTPDNPRSVGPMGMEGWHAMAEGIADGVNGVQNFDGAADYSTTLMTYHPCGGYSSSQWFHAAPWLDFNGAQVGMNNGQLCHTIAADYARTPPKPVVNLEPWYEGCPWKRPPVNDWEARAQAYQSFLSGACGHTYGHDLIYAFDSPPGEDMGGQWREHLNAPGRSQMRHLRVLLEATGAPPLTPLPGLVTDSADGGHAANEPTRRIAALRTGRGAIVVYTPRGQGFSLSWQPITQGPLQASWFDPRTGQTQNAEPVGGPSNPSFDPPGDPGEGQDWVLVLWSEGTATTR